MADPIRVAILMGSDNDWEAMSPIADILGSYDVPHEVLVASAHRTPDRVRRYVEEAPGRGVRVFIAGAGHAAHLAGVIAAHTTLPVIGVPIPSSALQGLDSLLSTAQMPGGVPVATMALGRSGAKNAAILAVQILALADEDLARRLREDREAMVEKVERASDRLQEKLR